MVEEEAREVTVIRLGRELLAESVEVDLVGVEGVPMVLVLLFLELQTLGLVVVAVLDSKVTLAEMHLVQQVTVVLVL
jgi:hypothetical protein